MTLYIMEQGAYLSKRENKLLIKKDSKILKKVPLRKVKKITLVGNIGITTPLMGFFLDNDINVIFMTVKGKFRGKLYKGEYKNVCLRLNQYKNSIKKDFKIKISRDIVKGKLENYIYFINKKARGDNKESFLEIKNKIFNLIPKLNKKDDMNFIRGIEGIASKYYFRALKLLVKNENFKFKTRTYKPPKDRFNSLLSLGYNLLYNEVLGAINVVGLDPYFGNLHEISMSKKALLFDMVEEYRCLIIDGFILKMINRNEINYDDFNKSYNGGFYLNDESFKKFISKYEKMMELKIPYFLDKEKNTLRTIFQKQLRQYIRFLNGEIETYLTFRLD